MSAQDRGEEAARLAAIVSSSDDAIVSKTLDGIITSWNAAAERIFGYSAEEMIGQPITKIIPTELLNEEAHIIAMLRRGERVEHFETVRLGKDGRRLDLSITVSPMLDNTGRIFGASKVARDISGRKRAEEVQRLLIDELNHRIKNTLATVQAIAQQTLRRAPDPQSFVSSFNGRIQALARAHGLLTGNSFQSAELGEIAREQLALEGWDRTRIHWSGPIVRLAAQPALHLSLVLHELGVNARKHGALSAEQGQVEIGWRVSEGRDGAQLRLIWEERGGPLTMAPTRRGFGSTLIEQSLSAHGGVVTLSYPPEGLRCEINMPLPPLAQHAEESLKPTNAPRRTLTPAHVLAGRRVLVIEDEPLIAMTLTDDLADLGCGVLGPAHSITQALALIASEPFDAALLDGNLSGDRVDEIANALAQKGKPFVFVTGYGREALPAAFNHVRAVEKPFTREQIASALSSLFPPSGGDVVRLRG
ncbi:MAG TPA: PAS domain S-box protein [Terricaulis sp.]|nr:PAS domain S-box protein [Terricaulis sp.]